MQLQQQMIKQQEEELVKATKEKSKEYREQINVLKIEQQQLKDEAKERSNERKMLTEQIQTLKEKNKQELLQLPTWA